MRRRKDKLDSLLSEYYKSEHVQEFRDSDYCFKFKKPKPSACLSKELFVHELSPDKKKEPCPSLTSLSAYIESIADEKEKVGIESHLKECSKCKEKVKIGIETMQEYKEGKLQKTPEDITSKLNRLFKKDSEDTKK